MIIQTQQATKPFEQPEQLYSYVVCGSPGRNYLFFFFRKMQYIYFFKISCKIEKHYLLSVIAQSGRISGVFYHMLRGDDGQEKFRK